MEIISPQQLADEGQAAYNKGDYLAAARLYKAAADGFITAENELSAAEMANNCSVAFLKGGSPELALQAVGNTDLVFAERGDTLRQAMAVGNQAAALEGLDYLDQAIEKYEESAGLLESLGESELRAYVHQSISAIQLHRGQFMDAYTSMARGVMGLDKPNLTQKLLKSLMQLPFKFIR
jgi:tetratricopeptide (TPR) repeat protein